MKLKLFNIVNSREAFQELLREKLPIKIVFRLREILRLIEPKFQTYEDLRTKMITEKYGEQTSSGWTVKDSMKEDFILELNELASEDIELDIEKVKLPDETKITYENVGLLEWIIEVE